MLSVKFLSIVDQREHEYVMVLISKVTLQGDLAVNIESLLDSNRHILSIVTFNKTKLGFVRVFNHIV